MLRLASRDAQVDIGRKQRPRAHSIRLEPEGLHRIQLCGASSGVEADFRGIAIRCLFRRGGEDELQVYLQITPSPKGVQTSGDFPGLFTIEPSPNGWTVVGGRPGVLMIQPLPNGWTVLGGCPGVLMIQPLPAG